MGESTTERDAKGTVIVTGGTAGLGLACAEECARRGWHVIVTSRELARGEVVARDLRARTKNEDVQAAELDLASLESVRAFARKFEASQYAPLRALVCNAGAQFVNGTIESADGIEMTFAVNHLGHFLLANLLEPAMPARARITFVSSDTHDPKQRTGMPPPQWEDPNVLARGGGPKVTARGDGFAGRQRYTNSKLCNVLTAYEMNRRISPRVAVNAFDPGFMPGTDLARDYGAFARFAFRWILPVLTLFVPNVNRVAVSGKRLAELAIGPSYEGIRGKYVTTGRVRPSSLDSYDEEKARVLWTVSEELVGKSLRIDP
jgi:light-dependent protochlorophyllide reductase